jgi:hypothetical protein
MKTKQFILINSFALAIAFTSCKKDTPIPSPTSTSSTVSYNNGVFVTNEGPYNSGTGTITFYRRDSAKVIEDVFQGVNNYPLGNVVQSMTLFNDKGYIVVNNSGKVEVVDGNTIKTIASITNLTSPRYFLGVNINKGYISQWNASGAGSIKVVNLSTNAITGSIPTGAGAERMVKYGNSVYVTCGGGLNNDSVVTVIDAVADTVVKTIKVGADPSSIQVDANGKIWVLCMGEWDVSYTSLVKPGSLVRINPITNTVELSLPFSSSYAQPSDLVINNSNTMLYYLYNGGVYSQDITSSSLSSTATINRNFYSLGIDPTNNYFYCGDPGNYSSNGKVLRYNASGAILDSFASGVIPGNFCFK